jgi:hypothetical protein
MTLGLRALLLIVAIVLFLVATISDNWSDLVALGLAAFAGALLVGELGIAGVKLGGRRRL